MSNEIERPFRVVQCVELGASPDEVWAVVGGFYTIHQWHPDIQKTEVPADQTHTGPLRRELTFPGQPITVEELVVQDNPDRRYIYKWHAGAWGEMVKEYRAELRVFEIEPEKRCIVQWSSTFLFKEDAVSEFYWNGFRVLQQRFPLP
jgi:hypothetical protein